IRDRNVTGVQTCALPIFLAVLGETTPDVSIFQAALAFSEFENMKKMEAAGAFDSKILRPGDVRDPESFKVRRGKIGGYREYLSRSEERRVGKRESRGGGG